MSIRLLTGLVLLTLAAPCIGDVIHLDSGTVEGEIISENDDAVEIRTLAGVVTIPRARIRRIERKPTPLQEHEAMARQVADDDTVGHYALGLWCKDKRLAAQAREHFEQVLKYDPEHEGAREELGYERYRGQWLTRDEAMQAKGYVKHDNRWVTPQVKAQLVKEENQAQFSKQIARLAKTISNAKTAQKREEAIAELSSMDHPDAVAPLGKKADHEDETVREAIVVALSNIATAEAADELARIVLIEPTPELRAAALAGLRKIAGSDATGYFVSALRTYRTEPVSNKEEVAFKRDVLSNASWALGEIGEQRAVPALISVLIVDMGYTVVTTKRTPVRGPTTVTGNDIGPDGNPTGKKRTGRLIRANPGGTTTETEHVKFINDEARDALKKITGEDFKYDKEAWGEWWLMNKPVFDTEDPLDE